MSRRQLLERGLTQKAIERRLAKGRLHRLWRGVYAVGRPTVTTRGWWMAALLACGDHAALSHESAAQLWGIREMNTGNEREQPRPRTIDVSVPGHKSHRLRGIRLHRRMDLMEADLTEVERIPVTTASRTLIDLATALRPNQLEACLIQADKLRLVDPERLRRDLDYHRGLPGARSVRTILDRRTFRLTDSELERRFLRLVRKSGLPLPKTQQRVRGFRVDFFWPDLRLVVETDGLRYHRTPSQQARDRARDQALVAAGLVAMRFTHAQVVYEAQHVIRTLRAVMNSISSDFAPPEGQNRSRSR